MTRLEFIRAEKDFTLTMLGLVVIAIFLVTIGELAVAGTILLLAGSMFALLCLAMLIDDEGRKYLHIKGK